MPKTKTIDLDPSCLRVEVGSKSEVGRKFKYSEVIIPRHERTGRSYRLELYVDEGRAYLFYITPEALYEVVVDLFKNLVAHKSNHEKIALLQSFMKAETQTK